MKHQFTISTDEGFASFDEAYEWARFRGAQWFELCEEHSHELVIQVTQSVIELDGSDDQEITTAVVEWDDNEDGPYNPCAVPAGNPSPTPAKAFNDIPSPYQELILALIHV